MMEIMDAIVSRIVDYTIAPVARQVGYVIHCESNMKRLEHRMEDLEAAIGRLQRLVEEAERKLQLVTHDAISWLERAGQISVETDVLFRHDNQAKLKCLYGFCPNLTTRYQLSRISTKYVFQVEYLLDSYKSYDLEVSWSVSTGEYLAFPSRGFIVERIMDELKNPSTYRIGVYGIGGVGKTTLLKEVYRQATDKKLFDDVVILLDVTENPHMEEIQNKIIRKLDRKRFEHENLDGSASRPSSSIQDKNILVILDNEFILIDLEALELPSVATFKILLASRMRRSLSGMSTQVDYELDVLTEEDAWALFKEKAGDVVEDLAIRRVATQVAKCCCGLPILVVTVAGALKKQTTLPPWEDAWRYLNNSDGQDLTGKAYLCLEWSYNQLKDKELEQLFLLCGFAIWGKDIYLPALLKYSMGLGLFRKGCTLEQAQDALVTWVGKLKDSCLLTASDDSRYVRMHEVVRDAANRIALRDHHILSSVEDEGHYKSKEWLDEDFKEKCSVTSLQSSTIPVLSEVPRIYPKLKLFYLHGIGDISVEIPPNFFREIKEVRVLDLSRLHMLALPSSLQFLKNLHALFLDQCIVGDIALVGQLSNLEILSFFKSNLKQLPKEIGKLTRLRLLDLSDCSELEVIAPSVISSLERLQELRMRNSFNKWEIEGGRSNASLSELKHLYQLSVLEIHIPDIDFSPANLFSHKLERFNIFIGDAWVDRYTSQEKFMAETTLNTLKLKLTTSIKELDEGLIWILKRCEDLSLSETEGANNIAHHSDTEESEHLQHLQAKNYVDFTYLNMIGLPNLTRLAVHRCDGLSFLLSSSMAKSFLQLKHLRVSKCQIMEEIVSTESYGEENGEENSNDMFPKLEQLELSDLPYLTRFCSGSYVEFAALERLQLDKCTKLETYIFNHLSNSIPICGEIKEMAGNHENVETSAPRFLFDEKVGFPRLERLTINDLPRLTTIWHTQLAPESFCRLREITVQQCSILRNSLPDSIITRVYQQLQKLTVEFSVDIWCSRPSPEVFCVEADLPGNSSRQTDGFLPQSLKTLRLQGIEIKFMRLSKQTPVFPLLEILELKFCGLNNLELSAISFRNLTILEVTFCWRLQYLTTYSVAQSLVGLERLKIDECKNMKEIFTSEGIEEDASNCEIVFSRLQHLELSDLISLERFCSRKCTVKVPSLKSTALQVNWCPFQLKISTGRVLEEVVSDMHQVLKKSHTGREEVLDPIEPACSLETNQKQHVPFTSGVAEDVEFKDPEFNAGPLHEDRLVNDDGPLLPDIAESSEHEALLPAVSESSERGVEAVIQESPINLQNLELAEVEDLKQKPVITNTPKNVQDAKLGMEECLIEPLNANEGRPLQLKQLDEVQTDSLPHSISKLEADIKRLQEELRAKEAEMRDKQQRLADERLATVDRMCDSLR